MAKTLQKSYLSPLFGIVGLFCTIMMSSGVSGQQSKLFKFIKTIQVTPDPDFLNGQFARINYIHKNDHFIVTFSAKLAKPIGPYTGSAYAYKEYTADMQPTGKSGIFSSDYGDSGSRMIDDAYYFVSTHEYPGQFPVWRIVKYDPISWNALFVKDLHIDFPREQPGDPMVTFINGQFDFSGQYNVNGHYPDFFTGAATFHYFFSANLDSISKKILSATPHVVGSSMLFVDGIYYFVTANAFLGDVVLMRYDKDWQYLGVKTLIQKAHFSTGMVFDGQRFYLSYLNTSQRAPNGGLPVHLNVRLATFDRDWNLIEDLAVTNYSVSDNKQPGRPWIILHNNNLYVSYDLCSMDSITGQELTDIQGIIKVYELIQSPNTIKQPETVPLKFRLEQNNPNPFNRTTAIKFTLPAIQKATLKLYDIFGREVSVLFNEIKEPGNYTVSFNAKDLPSGLYFYKLQVFGYTETKRLIVLK